MPNAPVAPETVLRIAELASDGIPVRQIARELDIAPSTVTRTGRRLGIRFDRSATAAATAARIEDAKAKRTDAAIAAIEEAMAELGRLRLPMRIVGIAGGNNAGVFERTIPKPTGSERLNIARTFRTLIDAHLRLAEVDNTDAATDHAKSMLGNLMNQMNQLSAVDGWLDHLTSGESEEASPRDP